MAVNEPDSSTSQAASASTPAGGPADNIRVRRVPDRATYVADDIHEILDAGLVAHVGTVRDGRPVVIPMYYVRDGDSLLLHGAPAAGALRRGKDAHVCVTVTHLDGIVLARSAFHHSMNYRSVVIVGVATPVTEPDEKVAALDRFVEALVPGRQRQLRPTTKKEIDGTTVLRLPLTTASAKVRTGGPIDDEEDYELPIWAGVLGVHTVIDEPSADPRNLPGIAVPDNVRARVTT